MENYFTTLNSINVNDKTEKKNGLTYLSWAWAWGELKKRHPDATYTIYENKDGLLYHTDGKSCWVKTGVTVNGLEHIEYLPVMDYKNRSISAETVTSTDVNKAVQRSLTKAVARHGLGLYIYAGEDLPDDGSEKPPKAEFTPNVYEPDRKGELRASLIKACGGDADLADKACKKRYGKGLKEVSEEELKEALSLALEKAG